ncbi:hypothetical protein OUZ56_003989 [Daphnia magna]|uniref:Uncharacterized protein n=1 Tax=Daphnia magna TaxID=35525 RepID=A0ABQ9YNJ5_9CRUS|nr:hypothetical protein OUZ56_003989 [Daphnia magna]
MTFATTALHLSRSLSPCLSPCPPSLYPSLTYFGRRLIHGGWFQAERTPPSSRSDPSVRSVRSISQHPALSLTYLTHFSFPFSPFVFFLFCFDGTVFKCPAS